MDEPLAARSELTEAVAAVVATILDRSRDLSPDDVMLVGAQCRDILHALRGHTFTTAATHDLDLALAVRSPGSYSAVIADLPRRGASGIRYDIAGTAVDLVPFGGIEDPPGIATPTERGDPLSVWGMTEVHARASVLKLDGPVAVRLPTAAGYAALKLVAWLDRREPRDAADLALAAYWYANDSDVEAELWAADAWREHPDRRGLRRDPGKRAPTRH